jgi:shikimate kinase
MKRIFLIGYMGSGKTTIGKVLAHALGLSFIDLDWYIEERFHKTISELFAGRGEDGFRQLERKMFDEVVEMEDVVIATGGGTPCFFDNMDVMNSKGQTVFLQASSEVLFERLRVAKQQRPILQNKSSDELKILIIETLEKRVPFYSRAHITFQVDHLEDRHDIEAAAEAICLLLDKA